MSRSRVTIVHSRYGWYQRRYFEELLSALDIRLVTMFDDLPDDPMPHELATASGRISLSMPGVRVKHYTASRLLLLLRTVWRATRRSNAVLTSTQNPVHSKVAWLVARLRRIPLCVIVEQWQDYPNQGLAKLAYNGISKRLMRSADRVFVHGEYARAFAERVGVKPQRIRRYPHMNADLGDGAAVPMPDGPGLRVLYVGRFVEVKGLDILIEAFEHLICAFPDARLRLFGEGPLRSELERQAAGCEYAVEIGDRVAPADLKEVMSWCHVLVLPSRQLPDAYEGWGLVVGEAASLGRALVVSSVVGSAPELVVNGVNGYVVEEGSAAALSDALESLASSPLRVSEMGVESRRLWESYCDARECVRLLREVIA